jgi:hypothetical protein
MGRPDQGERRGGRVSATPAASQGGHSNIGYRPQCDALDISFGAPTSPLPDHFGVVLIKPGDRRP